jgi:hypothetical protein
VGTEHNPPPFDLSPSPREGEAVLGVAPLAARHICEWELDVLARPPGGGEVQRFHLATSMPESTRHFYKRRRECFSDVSHENVEPILEARVIGEGHLVRSTWHGGLTLRQLLDRCAAAPGDVPTELVWTVLAGLCAGAAAIQPHTAQWVEYRLVPEVIDVGWDGVVRLPMWLPLGGHRPLARARAYLAPEAQREIDEEIAEWLDDVVNGGPQHMFDWDFSDRPEPTQLTRVTTHQLAYSAALLCAELASGAHPFGDEPSDRTWLVKTAEDAPELPRVDAHLATALGCALLPAPASRATLSELRELARPYSRPEWLAGFLRSIAPEQREREQRWREQVAMMG